MIVFHSDLLLHRRISFSPPPPPSVPPATFREAHLRPKPTYSEAHAADLPASGNPAGNQQLTRRHARLFSGSVPSTRRRVSACVGACCLLRRRASTRRVVRRRLGILPLRRSNPSPPYPPFGLFCFRRRVQFFSDAFSSSPATSVHPQSSSVHLQSYSLRFGSPFSSSSSSTAVIRPLIRALFNPNVVQSPVK